MKEKEIKEKIIKVIEDKMREDLGTDYKRIYAEYLAEEILEVIGDKWVSKDAFDGLRMVNYGQEKVIESLIDIIKTPKTEQEVSDEIRKIDLIASFPKDRERIYEFLIKSWQKKLKNH